MLLLLIAFIGMKIRAQQAVEVSTARTVSLSFPASVSYVDLGNTHIDARVVGPGSKVVLVKALEQEFAETNLTVVTVDDVVFSFRVKYHPSPANDKMNIPARGASASNYAAGIIDNGQRAVGMVHNKDGLYAQVQGIYVLDSMLFFHLKISNTTTLTYDIAALRFMVTNAKGGKRTASQQRLLHIKTLEGAYKQVPRLGIAVMVAVLPKIALPHNLRLQIEIIEQDGGRNLRLVVPPRKLAKAILLPVH